MLMFEALGEPAPRYAHLPLILGPDRAKLSKRHGAVAVEWFREHGFLPEALVNYLALLGWSPGHNEEILPREELVSRFDLDGVSHHPAVFDMDKLTWMNGDYIRKLADEELAARMIPFLADAGLTPDLDGVRAVAPHVKERMRTLEEAPSTLRFLFTDDVALDDKARAAVDKVGADYLRAAADRLETPSDWTVESISAALDEVASGAGLNRSKGWQPIRAAVTGTTVSPPLPESLELLGRDRTLARIRAVAAGG
jgi:glutamyl-tRNA synthetase